MAAAVCGGCAESVRLKIRLLVDTAVGVPVIAPVDEFNASPVGSGVAGEMLHV